MEEQIGSQSTATADMSESGRGDAEEGRDAKNTKEIIHEGLN